MADHYKLQHLADSGHVVILRSLYARMYTFLIESHLMLLVLKHDCLNYQKRYEHLDHHLLQQ
jgi:hypothetical protein